MIVEFDPTMQEHIRRIKTSEIHYHYLGRNIQNKLILMVALEIKDKLLTKLRKQSIFQLYLIVLQMQATKNKCLSY